MNLHSVITHACLYAAVASSAAIAAPTGGVAVLGNSLSEATTNYASATNLPRVDCDPVDSGRWICASFPNPTLADVGETTPDPVTPGPVESPTGGPVTPPASGRVAAVGATLGQARANYAAATSLPRADCDQLSDGRWICASFNNPQLADVGSNPDPVTPPIEPTPPVTPTPAVTPAPQPPAVRIAVIASTLGEAQTRYRAATSLPRADCDQLNDGRWICASFNNPQLADVDEEPVSPPTNPPSPSTPPSSGNAQPLPGDSLFARGDLIVLNYDSCPDADDIHASVAGKMVVDYYDLRINEDYIVNNGVCGDDLPRSAYIERSPQIFNQLYGSNWNDAFDAEPTAIMRTAEFMRNTLNSGSRVWIAEGGPMDFTARVIRELQSTGFNGNIRDIVLVQHSEGFNQRETDNGNLAFVQQVPTYLLIANGNLGGNATPQLNQQNSSSSNYQSVDQALVNRFRNNGTYGADWGVSFGIFPPNNRFDGSDTVEVMWILGVRSNEVADWYEFADAYLP